MPRRPANATGSTRQEGTAPSRSRRRHPSPNRRRYPGRDGGAQRTRCRMPRRARFGAGARRWGEPGEEAGELEIRNGISENRARDPERRRTCPAIRRVRRSRRGNKHKRRIEAGLARAVEVHLVDAVDLTPTPISTLALAETRPAGLGAEGHRLKRWTVHVETGTRGVRERAVSGPLMRPPWLHGGPSFRYAAGSTGRTASIHLFPHRAHGFERRSPGPHPLR